MTPAAVRSARRPTSGRTATAPRGAGRARASAGASPRPRRVSGPIGGRARAQAALQPTAKLGERALAVVRSLPNRSLIDRLVRGRAWIPVLGVLLAGLVAMQVEILKLGTSIGRSIERSTALQSQNESLQVGVAALANDRRIERLAAGMGLAMPSPSSVVFVPANAHNAVGRALTNIRAPDPANFASQLAAQIAAAAMIDPAASATGADAATPTSGGTATSTSTATNTGTATSTDTAATSATGATAGASTTTGTPAGPASTAPATSPTTTQSPAAQPATGPSDTAQPPATSAPAGTTEPTGATPANGAAGAAALTPSSGTQSSSPPGG